MSFGYALTLLIIYNINNIEKLNTIIRILFYSCIVDLGISVLESFQLFRWPISILSPIVNIFGRKVEFYNIINDYKRNWSDISYVLSQPTGFHWNPNNLGLVLVILFPFFLLYKNKLLSLILCVTSFFLIIQANARLCFLAIIFTTLCSLIYLKRRYYLSIIILIMTVITISFGFYKVFNNRNIKIREMSEFTSSIYQSTYVYINNEFLHNKIEINDETKKIIASDTSRYVRGELIKKGLSYFNKSKFTGIGGGNIEYYLAKEGGIGREKIINLHFFWLEILIEAGVIYFIFFNVWYFSLIILLFKAGVKSKNASLSYLAKACSLSLIGFFVGSIAISSAFYFLPMYLLLGISFSVLTIYNKTNESTVVI